MDLFLLDAILKGKIPESGNVLDIGCGEGRNGIYFMKEGFDYFGIDQDPSKVSLLEYLAKQFSIKASFKVSSFQEASFPEEFDLIIASRVLHFAESQDDFRRIWSKIAESLKERGVVYFSLDSAIIEHMVTPRDNGLFEFADGRVSQALTESHYDFMLEGFSELEELRTVVHGTQRVQSTGLLKKST